MKKFEAVPLQAQTEDAGVKGSLGDGRAENRFQELAFWHGLFSRQPQIGEPVGNRGTVKIEVVDSPLTPVAAKSLHNKVLPLRGDVQMI